MITENTPDPAVTKFQQELCRRIIEAASVQGLNVTQAKGVKLQRFYIENIRGACLACEVLGSPQLNPLLIVFMLVCTRGAEVVHALAEGKAIP